ncbi:MAG: hypothetical protein QM811_13265 [Pirellulales bacterium]
MASVGYVDGVGACDVATPKHNLTGDPYYTDGKRAVVALSQTRVAPHPVELKPVDAALAAQRS